MFGNQSLYRYYFSYKGTNDYKKFSNYKMVGSIKYWSIIKSKVVKIIGTLNNR